MKKTGLLNSNNIKSTFRMYFSYSICFCIAAVLVFWYFIYYQKSMVWSVDGLYQHYNAFIYLGSWVREIIKNLLIDHRLIIPMWEWGLGLGADVITTLSYYTFGDPFALVSVITPTRFAVLGYSISIILRFYFSGITFCLYSRKMGCKIWCTVSAAILYTFCAFSVYSGIRHPYFISPMIYFPLILLGCEKIFRKESPIILVLAVFISAVSNFYFFYMLVIFTIIYVMVRLLSTKETREIKYMFTSIIGIGVSAMVGVLLSAMLFLPNVMAFLNNTRVSDVYEFSMLYSLAEYEGFLGSFIGVSSSMPWAYIGMAPIAYLATDLSFIQRKKENRWAIFYIVIQLLFLAFPVFGHIMNGFGYVSNRWVFVWAFTISFLFAKKLPELLNLTTKEKGYLSLGYGIYTILCVAIEKSRSESVLIGAIALLVSLAFVWCAPYIKDFKFKRFKISAEKIKRLAVILLVFTFIQQIAYQRYSHLEGDYLEKFHGVKSSSEVLYKEVRDFLKVIEDDEFYRVENSNISNSRRNFLAADGQSSTMAYWSLINPNVTEFLELNAAFDKQSHCNRGFQSRSMLLPLACAGYYVAVNSDNPAKTLVPYNFNFVGESEGYNDTFYIYKSENTLPFGFTYDEFISKEQYEKVSFSERQQLMLQAAVIDEQNECLLQEHSPDFNDINLDYWMTLDDNIDVNGDTFIVKKKNSEIVFEFEAPENCELYFTIEGLDFDSVSSYSYKTEEYWEDLSGYENAKIKHKLKYWEPATETTLYVKSAGVSNKAIHYNEFSNYATGREDYLINLGYSEKSRTKIVLTFDETGTYSYKDISIIAQPMSGLNSYITDLSTDSMVDVEMSTNKITGEIVLEEPKLLCMSLPYTEGWTCYIDGEKTDTIKTNIMLTGVMLDEGAHSIELEYKTPYIFEGLLLSMVGVVMTLAICLFHHLFYKKKRY